MSESLLWLVLAVAAVVIAIAAAVLAWSVRGAAMDVRLAAQDAERLVSVLTEELPPTLASLERAATSLEQLAGESGARLVAMDRLADEGEATMVAMRELSSSVNEILRGPAETVTGVRRSARMVGQGIASGADRIRRVIVKDGGGDELDRSD